MKLKCLTIENNKKHIMIGIYVSPLDPPTKYDLEIVKKFCQKVEELYIVPEISDEYSHYLQRLTLAKACFKEISQNIHFFDTPLKNKNFKVSCHANLIYNISKNEKNKYVLCYPHAMTQQAINSFESIYLSKIIASKELVCNLGEYTLGRFNSNQLSTCEKLDLVPDNIRHMVEYCYFEPEDDDIELEI